MASTAHLERCPRCLGVSAFHVAATGYWACLTCGILEPSYQPPAPQASDPAGDWPRAMLPPRRR